MFEKIKIIEWKNGGILKTSELNAIGLSSRQIKNLIISVKISHNNVR